MIPYGKMFYSGEVILIYIQEEPAFFARVEEVTADVKKGWWRMTFTILSIPLDTQSWLLDDDQMRGQAFTMNKVPVRIERVEKPASLKQEQPQPKKEKPGDDGESNVVSFFGDD